MIKLVKTVGGTHGSPLDCGKCGSKHFAKSGVAWHCIACGNYHPTSFGFDVLKKNILRIDIAMSEFKKSIDDLEKVVKE